MLNITANALRRSDGRASFKLTRFFSTTSLVGIVVVIVFLILTYRELTVRHLIAHEGRANSELTRAFSNAVWAEYRDFVINSSGRSREDLLADPVIAYIQADIRQKMKGLQIAKIKIYNLDGLTIFSTDESQIGEDKSGNPGFRNAILGSMTNQMSFRENFDAFEGTLSNRNLIASYIPVVTESGAPIEGVFEVYSDVTELLKQQSQAQWQVAGIVLFLLGTLYLFLFFVVRKADRIIDHQKSLQVEKEAEVRHQAYHDALTGLPNRTYFTEQLEESVALALQNGHNGALMYIDLDRFKKVNDSLGHHAGDLLLQEISSRIQSCLRAGDLLFRIGGDEFTVILPKIDVSGDAASVARHILEKVSEPMMIHDHEILPGASIGIAVYPADGEAAQTLLKNADAAMYNAKKIRRGSHAFYRAAMNTAAHQHWNLENDLRQALSAGEFELYFQPRFEASSRRIVALEALLRWNSPSRGIVLPGGFIDVLEDTGMIHSVGEWVLRTACAHIVDWKRQGHQALRVSVNVSSLQFHNPLFVKALECVLSEFGVPAELIELELTESNLIGNSAQARQQIDSLKQLGVSISIDDFGTGYSSLNYLRQFDVDYLKIDRSFVTEITTDARCRAVATAIIDLAKALGIVVVAEGIETEDQARFFAQANCGELQGFLYSKPLPIDELRRYVSALTESSRGKLVGESDKNLGDPRALNRKSPSSDTQKAPDLLQR